MSDISAMNSAMAGIQTGLEGMRKNAMEIARSGPSLSTEQLTTSIVDLKSNQLQVQASAKVLETVDKTIGSLFDDKA